MEGYRLIDLDQMEESVVRRRLRRWSKADQEAITPIVQSLLTASCLDSVDIVEPVYETNVYPLFYYWTNHKRIRRMEVGNLLFQELSTNGTIYSVLQEPLSKVIDTEIDILVEDLTYFAFIEVKQPSIGRRATFQKQGGIHQLVKQYVQGKILERSISKTFCFGTMGANNGQALELTLNPNERALLQLVHDDRQTLSVPDIAWP